MEDGAGSGEAGEFREVGFAFVEVGAVALFAFVGHVEEQGGVAGKFLQSGLAVAVGVEGRLQAAQGERAVLEDFADRREAPRC